MRICLSRTFRSLDRERVGIFRNGTRVVWRTRLRCFEAVKTGISKRDLLWNKTSLFS